MKLFALGSSAPLGESVAARIDAALGRHEERVFEDGEHKFRPLESVRGRDVFVLHSLFGEPGQSVNDKLCQLLFFLGAARDAGAARVTAVTPYLPYSRKDRRTKARDPLVTRYIAQLFEAMNIDMLVTIDVHNISAFENAFRQPVIHLDTRKVFVDHLLKTFPGETLAVASPDPGGVKRAQLFREYLESASGRAAEFAFMEKRRSAGVVSGAMTAGDVSKARVIIVDDLISTGGTMARAARAFRERGAAKVCAVAAHGLFVGGAEKALRDPCLEKVFVTDTIPPFRLPATVLSERVEIVSVAPLIAETIWRLHQNESITDLLNGPF